MIPPPQAYLGYQLVIRSTVAIPGGVVLAGGQAEHADIHIEERPLETGAPTRVVGPYKLTPKGLCFEVAGVARYLCTAQRIIVERADGARDDLVSGYLGATALPACLWMRGAFVLHAGAATLAGAEAAVAIAGASGSGKSFLLRQLLGAGAKLVADDTLSLDAEGNNFVGSGLPGGYMLGAPPRVFHAVPSAGLHRSAVVTALVILQLPRDATRARFTRLTGVDAVVALLANRHRPRIPALLGLERAHLPLLGDLASRLPIFTWRRRQDGMQLDDLERSFLASL